MSVIVKRTNRLVTIFGGLAVLGQVPEAVTRAGINMPLVWNSITPWLSLCGIVFGLLAFWAAKGADQHSTIPQVEASTDLKKVEAAVQKAAEPAKPVQEVAIVAPTVSPEVLHDPESARKEIERLQKLLAERSQ